MIQENFIKIYEKSFKKNWELPALTDYSKGTTFSFADVAKEIARIHILFEECQIRRGDKIALIGKDSARWCIVYMAAVTYGAIIVPILQDFSPNDVHHIINHSESVFLFVSDRIWDTLEEEMIEDVRGVFSLSDFRCLHQRDGESIQKLPLDGGKRNRFSLFADLLPVLVDHKWLAALCLFLVHVSDQKPRKL